MKKIIYAFLALILFSGCTDLSNTPIKKTEEFLKKYQTLDSKVIEDLDSVINNDVSFNESQKNKYKDIMKKHYQNMTYEIKDDEIEGDDAKVTVEIEVTDFNKVLDDSEKYLKDHQNEFFDELGNYDSSKYIDYRLDRLKEAKEKVKYTIDIYLIKTDGKWQVKALNNDTLEKINGVYNY